MTQKQLIKEYLNEFGSILPAKLSGIIYKEDMFGSEISKRCRELRADGELRSEGDGKFERFYRSASVEPQNAPGKEIKSFTHSIATCPSYAAYKVYCGD